MLDENHDTYSYPSTGSNAYTLGSIHRHNVILLMLGKTGSVPATNAVARMRGAFPELEHSLLVGIGGGVPVKTDNGDIRLGDVVVGTPASVHPGTVRYD
jgi:nucleoside phosphorylase